MKPGLLSAGQPRLARSTGLALLAVLCAVPRGAAADDTHYQDYPLGGRAVGLGGAFTGLGDDPSGIWFNPAGIVDINRTSVQISTTLYGLEIAHGLFSTVHSVTDLEKVFTELSVIPSSGSVVSALGPPGPDGRPRQAYGFGVFVPSYHSLDVANVSNLPPGTNVGGCDTIAYERTSLDRTLDLGGAFAHRIDDALRFGFSGFLDYRTLSDNEGTTCLSSRGSAASTAFGTAQTDLSMFVGSLLFSFGVKADVSPGWSAGLTVTTPSIRVFNGASVRVTHGSADPATNRSQFTVQDLKGLSADSKLGTEVRAGIAYVEPARWTFVADVSAHAPTRYDLFEIPADRRDVLNAITLARRVERSAVVNVNAGLEYLFSKSFSVSSGAFTNFTSAPALPGPSGSTFPDARLGHLDTFGASLVLGFFSEHTLTRVGLTTSYGAGSDIVPRYAGLGALGQSTQYVKVDLARTFFFFFLSSTFRY